MKETITSIYGKVMKMMTSKGSIVDNKYIKSKAYIMLTIGLVLLIVTSGLFGSNKHKINTVKIPDLKSEMQKDKQIWEMEKKISRILSNVAGVGKTEVAITLKEGKEQIIATETKRIHNYKNQDTASSIKDEHIKPQIINKNGREEVPIILKEIEPKIEGVLVVAAGAENPHIREQLHQALFALLNVQHHKIQILSYRK